MMVNFSLLNDKLFFFRFLINLLSLKKCLITDTYLQDKYTFTGRIKLVEIIRARSGGRLPCPGAGPASKGVPGGGTEQALGGCREWKRM